eukprot:11950908-Prorocentrum_lima.AAC.1
MLRGTLCKFSGSLLAVTWMTSWLRQDVCFDGLLLAAGVKRGARKALLSSWPSSETLCCKGVSQAKEAWWKRPAGHQAFC